MTSQLPPPPNLPIALDWALFNTDSVISRKLVQCYIAIIFEISGDFLCDI